MGYSYNPKTQQCLDTEHYEPVQMTEAPWVDGYHGNQAMHELVMESGCNDVNADGIIQMLVGGPYTDRDGDRHRYGHTSARVVSGDGNLDRVYDFGRYGATRGDFSAEGDGILREWDHSLDEYIAGQNALGRETHGYSFPATECDIEAAVDMIEERKEGAVLEDTRSYRGEESERRVYNLEEDYHGLTNNCTTLSADVLEAGRPDLEMDVADEQLGRGMNTLERMAASAAGWPEETFMPADVGAILDDLQEEAIRVEHWDPGPAGVEHSVLHETYPVCEDPAYAESWPADPSPE